MRRATMGQAFVPKQGREGKKHFAINIILHMFCGLIARADRRGTFRAGPFRMQDFRQRQRPINAILRGQFTFGTGLGDPVKQESQQSFEVVEMAQSR